MTKFTINVAKTTFAFPVGDTGLVTEFDLTKVPEAVLSIALVNGFMGALNNIARSNGKAEDPKSNKEWAKARADKVAVWYAGTWAANGGGERDTLPMRDAFYLEQRASDTQGRKRLDKVIRAKVTEIFGENESATFGRFLAAVAVELGRERKVDPATLEDGLIAKYTTLAIQLVKERQAASATIDVGALI